MTVNATKMPPLQTFRRELDSPRVSQERMARLAEVSLQTYRNAESGEEVWLSTAFSIWRALNQERARRGFGQVSFEQVWIS